MSAIALDPLIAEAKDRARRRRNLAIVLVVAVAARGAFFWRTPAGAERWTHPAKGESSNFAFARFAGYGLSFRYPANWKRLDCVQKAASRAR
jgi:hypothetical protein